MQEGAWRVETNKEATVAAADGGVGEMKPEKKRGLASEEPAGWGALNCNLSKAGASAELWAESPDLTCFSNITVTAWGSRDQFDATVVT